MTYSRRFLLAALAALPALPALAHHGWRWTANGDFELTGTITEARLGNPHGVLTVDVNGVAWVAEVGQPWRNARAGLEDAMLAPGTDITIQGKRAADPDDRKVKAEVVILNGIRHVLYPDRV